MTPAPASRDDGFTKVEPAAVSGLGYKIRLHLTLSLVRLVPAASPTLFVLALMSYCFLVLAWIKVKSAPVSTYSIVILSGLLAAILSRVGLLGFLEATSVPSNNLLYLLPVVPFYLLFVAASLALGVDAVRPLAGGER